MVNLALPLIALNFMSLIVCLCTLFTLGTEVKDVMKLFLVETYVSLTAFSLILLVVDKLALSIMCLFQQLYVLSAKIRQYMYACIADGLLVRDGDNVIVSANMLQRVKDIAKETTATQCTDLAPVTNEPSESGTPTFTQTDKDAPMRNEDACSESTTM